MYFQNVFVFLLIFSVTSHHCYLATEDDPTKEEPAFPTEVSLEPPDDDMLSFDEWRKAELAKKQGILRPRPSRKINFASLDCGAKIVASNKEGQGTAAHLLTAKKDQYMISPCDASVWLVVELCSSTQITQLELGHFELFSSNVRQFSVYQSPDFPVRQWQPLGTFAASPLRGVQAFPIHSDVFVKFLKIEVLSHYRDEHYCTLNVINVFGTSLIDEFTQHDDINENWDEDEDGLLLEYEDRAPRKTMFNFAKEAVKGMVARLFQPPIDNSSNSSAEGNATSEDWNSTATSTYGNCSVVPPPSCPNYSAHKKFKMLLLQLITKGHRETAEPTSAVPAHGTDEPVVSSTTEGARGTLAPKDSPLVRLGTKLHQLELNLSLSSTYLEELSRSYRANMEQTNSNFLSAFDAISQTFNTSRYIDESQEKELLHLGQQARNLSALVHQLLDGQESYHIKALELHTYMLAVELVVFGLFFWTYLSRKMAPRESSESWTQMDFEEPPPRSLVVVPPPPPPPKKKKRAKRKQRSCSHLDRVGLAAPPRQEDIIYSSHSGLLFSPKRQKPPPPAPSTSLPTIPPSPAPSATKKLRTFSLLKKKAKNFLKLNRR